MSDKNILYIPVGKKTFNMEEGEKQRKESSKLLNELSSSVYEPEGVVTSPDELNMFLDEIDTEKIELSIYQSVTFADAEAAEALIQRVSAPVIVWSIREPEIGGRLQLNSLTGGNSTSHHLRYSNHPYAFILGNAQETEVKENLGGYITHFEEKEQYPTRNKDLTTVLDPQDKQQVSSLIEDLKSINIGVIGEHPPGFYFSGADDQALRKTLGVTVNYYDLEAILEDCVNIPRERWEKAIDRAEEQVVGLKRNAETVERFAQFSTYLKEEIEEKDINGIAVRCYPEFFNQLGAAACSTLSQFTEDGIVSACESDIHGSVSMYILQELSEGQPPYLGDLVHVNHESNSAVFWHCGAGAYSLARPQEGARAGVHPNRKLGFTMEFGLKPGKVTIFRVSYSADGYQLLVMNGNALDVPQRFNGTSVEVAFDTNVTDTVSELIEEGMEPHYALVYADVSDQLIELGHQLGLKTIVYRTE